MMRRTGAIVDALIVFELFAVISCSSALASCCGTPACLSASHDMILSPVQRVSVQVPCLRRSKAARQSRLGSSPRLQNRQQPR